MVLRSRRAFLLRCTKMPLVTPVRMVFSVTSTPLLSTMQTALERLFVTVLLRSSLLWEASIHFSPLCRAVQVFFSIKLPLLP